MKPLANPADQYSSLARIFDPFTYPTHRIVLGLSLAFGVAAGLLILISRGDFGAAILAGLNAGAVTFITWVLTRELDPDDQAAALLALVLSGVASLALGVPGLMFLGSMLLIMLARIVNRTVGPAARPSDSLVILVLGTGAALVDFWGFGLVMALAFALDALLADPLGRHRLFAVLALLVAGIAFVQAGASLAVQISTLALLILVLSVAYTWTIATTRTLNSPCDRPGYTLNLRRVQAGMLPTLVAGLLLVVTVDEITALGLLSAYAAMAGVVLACLLRLLRP